MFKRWSQIIGAAFAIMFVIGASSAMAAKEMTLSLPDLNWALKIDTDGFRVQSGGLRPDGMATQMMAQDENTGLIFSIFIEPAQEKGDNHVCRAFYMSGLDESPAQRSDQVLSDKGNMAMLEYVIKEFQGVPLTQKHVNAYMVKDGFWIDIHLSKTGYADTDKLLFDNLLSSVAIVDGYVQSDMDNFIYASSFFMENNHAKAAKYYARALTKNRAETQLPDDLWHVAVDNLGMAYGMSGDLKNSKLTYLKGIEEDPDYAMFYYNLACTFSEMGDKTNALANLRKAYERKYNMLPGEYFPDPRTDSSFQKFLSDPDFVALLEEFGG